MTIKYKVIQAKNEHSSQITDLIFHIWTNEYAFNVDIKDYPDLKNIEDYYHNKLGNFIIALFNEEVIGTIACNQLSENSYVLKRMFVKIQYRGKGVAQALLDELLKDYNTGTIFFLSTNGSLAHAAKRLYLSNGFEIINRESLPVGFPYFYEDDLFMRKKLS